MVNVPQMIVTLQLLEVVSSKVCLSMKTKFHDGLKKKIENNHLLSLLVYDERKENNMQMHR